MPPSPKLPVRRGEAIAGHVLDDTWAKRVGRAGLLSRAANYLVLVALVAAVLLGRGDKELDRTGAVETVAGAPLGRVMLVTLCFGFICYIAWQLLRAAARRADQDAAATTARRALALGTAVVYAAFLVTTVRVLLGRSGTSPQGDQDSWTSRLLGGGGGRIVVVAAGAAIVVSGLGLLGYAVSQKFETPLNMSAMAPAMRRVAAVLGIVGQSARGVVLGIVGGFVLSAGLTDDPSKSKGLDASLKTLAQQRFGAIMLGVVGLGFLAFGLYSLVDARYREDFSR